VAAVLVVRYLGAVSEDAMLATGPCRRNRDLIEHAYRMGDLYSEKEPRFLLQTAASAFSRRRSWNRSAGSIAAYGANDRAAPDETMACESQRQLFGGQAWKPSVA
jgi:hypothetical protein